MELSDPEPIPVGCGEEGRGLMRKTRVVSCQCAENMTLDLKPSGGSSQRTTGRRWGAPRRGGGEMDILSPGWSKQSRGNAVPHAVTGLGQNVGETSQESLTCVPRCLGGPDPDCHNVCSIH